ncbi:MAG: gliding motility-associated ABC transporter permease subunit GldF [Bacteroidales bacterium]|nr:gliding motility-associated ABC transporter permease subunit GldF [Bacteroidales bacterium]
MFTLYKKEISSFLNSLIGYIVIVVFLLINSLFLWVFPTEFNIPNFGYASLEPLFLMAPFVFLFLIPAISMRMFAEEKKSGTIEILLTQPLSDMEIIMAKYFAILSLVVISLIPTLVFFITVYIFGFPMGNMDLGGTWGSYIGLIFLSSAFAAIGLFASSITDNQIVAFIFAIVITAFSYLGFEIIYSLDLFGSVDLFIKTLGINAHYSSMSRGVIDTRDILYFISFVAVFLMFTKLSLESRKW